MSKDDMQERMAKVRAMEAFGFKLTWIDHYHCESCGKKWSAKGRANNELIDCRCEGCGKDFIPTHYEGEWVNE